MSKIDKFVGTSQEFDIEGYGKIVVRPLKVKDMGLFKPNLSTEEQTKVSYELIRRSIEGEADVTDEKIAEMPIEIFTAIINAINEVNGFVTKERTI